MFDNNFYIGDKVSFTKEVMFEDGIVEKNTEAKVYRLFDNERSSLIGIIINGRYYQTEKRLLKKVISKTKKYTINQYYK